MRKYIWNHQPTCQDMSSLWTNSVWPAVMWVLAWSKWSVPTSMHEYPPNQTRQLKVPSEWFKMKVSSWENQLSRRIFHCHVWLPHGMSKATTLNKYIWNITDWVRGRPWNRYMWSHKKRNGQSHVSSKSNPNHQGLDHSKQQQPAFPDVLMIESKTLYSTINHPRCLDIHKQMFLQSNTPYNLPLTSRIAKNIYDYIIVFAVHISQCVSFLIFSSTTFLDHYRKVAGKTYASRIAIIKLLCAIHKCIHWLVVYLPLWKKISWDYYCQYMEK